MKILTLVLSLFPASLALAETSIDCNVVGSDDGIIHVSVEPTELEGQIAAYTTLQDAAPQKGSVNQRTLIRASNGSVYDERIYLYEVRDANQETSIYFLERAGARDDASIVRYTPCAPQPVVSDCSAQGLRAPRFAGRAECTVSGK
jgi:hypothetical protein